jgi:REP element-mobilizing transposase RayT
VIGGRSGVPRKPRVFLAGGTYHLYCRVARGERPFVDEAVAGAFVAMFDTAKAGHGLTILAWCVMPNHYHLVVRAGELPLWRSMRLVQGRFAKAFNRRRLVFGPVWQGRYKARLVGDPAYLMQAIAYVHLNPVASGLVRIRARTGGADIGSCWAGCGPGWWTSMRRWWRSGPHGERLF